MATRKRTYFTGVLLLFLAAPFTSFAGGKKSTDPSNTATATDTVRMKLAAIEDKSCTDQNSIIESMTDAQLMRLIDMLFELDSIPADLVAEITRVVKSRAEKTAAESPEPETKNNIFNFRDSLPATTYYSQWDTKHLAPMADLLVKNDTSFTLELTNDKIGKYTHPFSGVITSYFGWRDSTNHYGIDIDLNKGDPVVAAFDGMVRIAGREGGFGNLVVIRHYNGLETYYGHLSKVKVKPGDVVKSGQVIGLGGSTGHSTGSHLHFETRFKGVPINPVYFVSLRTEELIASDYVVTKTKYGMTAYPTDAEMYTVCKGDRLGEIAKKYGTTTKKLRDLNAVPKGRYMVIRVGQKIRVN